jgi:hypothetical protein
LSSLKVTMEKVFFDSGEQIKTSLDRFRIIFNFNDRFVFATTSLVIDILRQMAFAAKTLFSLPVQTAGYEPPTLGS